MNQKLRKIQMIFDIEIDFESQILALFDSLPLIQNSIISFGYVDFKAQICLILYPPFENFTTRIAITFNLLTVINSI